MTIDEFKEKIVPYMNKGYVAMDQNCVYFYYNTKPMIDIEKEEWDNDDTCYGLSFLFNIKPIKDWTKSLIEVGQ